MEKHCRQSSLFSFLKNPSRGQTSTETEDNIESMQSTSRHTETTAEIPAVTDVERQESNESVKEPSTERLPVPVQKRAKLIDSEEKLMEWFEEKKNVFPTFHEQSKYSRILYD
jgi:hypothetical protein